MRPTGQKTIAIEKIVCSLQFPREEGMLSQAGPQGRQEAEGNARKMWTTFFVGSDGKERVRQGKQVWEGLV